MNIRRLPERRDRRNIDGTMKTGFDVKKVIQEHQES